MNVSHVWASLWEVRFGNLSQRPGIEDDKPTLLKASFSEQDFVSRVCLACYNLLKSTLRPRWKQRVTRWLGYTRFPLTPILDVCLLCSVLFGLVLFYKFLLLHFDTRENLANAGGAQVFPPPSELIQVGLTSIALSPMVEKCIKMALAQN